MRLLFLISVISAALTQTVSANDCSDASSQKEMTDCAKQTYVMSDARLNANYAQLKQRLADDVEAEQQLVAAQRAWIAYRDAECAFSASGVTGGSIFSFVHTQCLNRLTQDRNADFDRYLKCQEGDLSCPAPK